MTAEDKMYRALKVALLVVLAVIAVVAWEAFA